MNAAVTGLTEAVRTMGQSVSKPRPEDMRVGKTEPYAPSKDFDDWDFTFNGCAGTLDPAYLALLKTARQSPTVVVATLLPRTAVCNFAVLSQDAHTERSTESREESWKQRVSKLTDTGLFVQVMTYKFRSKIEDAEDRLDEFLELVRRYDVANGTDPVPDQVEMACIISNTPELLKTHLQLNVGKLGNLNALRVAIEEYLRSRRIFQDDLSQKHSR